MKTSRLNEALGRLMSDRRLMNRFRRNPAKALAEYDLGPEELAAIERGDVQELMQRGFDPQAARPRHLSRPFMASLALRFGARLAPAALFALLVALAGPSPKSARAANCRSVIVRVEIDGLLRTDVRTVCFAPARANHAGVAGAIAAAANHTKMIRRVNQLSQRFAANEYSLGPDQLKELAAWIDRLGYRSDPAWSEFYWAVVERYYEYQTPPATRTYHVPN